MKRLTRRGFTAAGILAALGAGITVLPGCDVSGCSNPFDPSDNEIETVYGPPEYFGLEEDDEFDPSDNELEDVYGPPPDEEDSYQPEDNIEPPVYGPPEDFEPDENELVGVYGPPEGD